MSKIDTVKRGVDELRNKLLIKEPSDFSEKDFFRAFFGALVFGMTFALKGLLIDVSIALTKWHISAIILFTILIMTAEIYFIGYRRIIKKEERKFGQFWLKRTLVFYSVSIFVSLFLVYVYGLNNVPGIDNISWNIFRMVIAISMPCVIGAAISDLLKQY
ncbi:DUF2391 family protein [Candidatus Woesearchaeota archaeon]|nr:DUF2391 family protein [Candidatus Woesearchaeota archaeon]